MVSDIDMEDAGMLVKGNNKLLFLSYGPPRGTHWGVSESQLFKYMNNCCCCFSGVSYSFIFLYLVL